MNQIVFLAIGGVLAVLLSVKSLRELVLHPIELLHVIRFLLVGNKKQHAPPGSTVEQQCVIGVDRCVDPVQHLTVRNIEQRRGACRWSDIAIKCW